MAQSSGAGFLVEGRDGGALIVTNSHVIWGADEVMVDFSDGRSIAARVVGTDTETDVAVLRTTISLISPRLLSFADGEASHPGAWVFAFGSPGGVDC